MPFGRDAVGAGREPVTPEQFMAAGAVKRRELDAFDRLPVDREGYFGHVRLVGAAQGARQYRSDAVEFDYAGFGERLVDCAAFGRIMPFERLFETDGYGLPACYGNIGFTYGTAVAADYFQCPQEPGTYLVCEEFYWGTQRENIGMEYYFWIEVSEEYLASEGAE